MNDFFNGEVTQSIAWFSLTHFALLIGLGLSIFLLWYFSPKIKNSKYEVYIRYFLLFLFLIFEWKVFESRILNGSIFRLPLCAISLYLLTYSVVFKNEKVFKIAYFYSFGTYLTYLFFDTPWGLDRWGAWTFFGAHALIAWTSVYGINVLGYKIVRKDLIYSMVIFGVYSIISGYATHKYGGSDELFFFHPPMAELETLVANQHLLYVVLLCLVAAILMFIMYLPTQLNIRKK